MRKTHSVNKDWEFVSEDSKEVAIGKVKRNKNRASGGDSLLIDEEEVKKSC